MPFNRPTLTDLRSQCKSYLLTQLKKVGALLRFSNLGIIGDVVAGMSHLHFGYLDWIAKQSNPYTATDEYLAAWAALKDIYRKAATAATGKTITLTGTAGSVIPAGTLLNRSDGYQYTVNAELTIGSAGNITGAVTAVLPDTSTDSTGGGEDGNADAGTVLTLNVAIDGVDTTATATAAITGGADIEDEEVFRSRMLLAYQEPPQGGSDADYKEWALAVPGVTRAWVTPRLLGAGTVGVYFMMDPDGATTNDNSFPSGTDGYATKETQYSGQVATGDQLTVADYIYSERPVTATVYVASPIKTAINFEISGIATATSTTKSALQTAISNILFDDGEPGGTIYLTDIIAAIAAVDNTAGFLMTSPTENIVMATGGLPVLGSVTYA
ncbi:baseplate J/gp47 family protein [Pantoea stewartii]|uniref:Phage baseplate J-like protein n=1 Tax=Pantoea stewartii subsp. stewartii DC283 TaxID=660596 RepID=H3RLN8_PANSE|nr:baseplate J/gp47 family protein [Pantoea stewartii]ARF52793.1 phage baseplate protein [Pantoea stewartii subsp. stewartii DC283]EHT97751.1 phage baseplate J-like protein [Pantoea stewartii subsp. stewartii DC283]KAB0553974.1 baseplate J/gp47 family protein [Pantoea stewartii subsp. stewartii]